MMSFISTGKDPGQLQVTHTCDNPPCCNPAHLVPETLPFNLADMVSKGRSARGAKNARAKLKSDQDVELILKLNLEGKSFDEIGAIVGIGGDHVRQILKNKCWIHVPRLQDPILYTPPPPPTPEERLQILTWFAAGASETAIGRKLNRHKHFVRGVMQEALADYLSNNPVPESASLSAET